LDAFEREQISGRGLILMTENMYAMPRFHMGTDATYLFWMVRVFIAEIDLVCL
jgi:hypothetical protein